MLSATDLLVAVQFLVFCLLRVPNYGAKQWLMKPLETKAESPTKGTHAQFHETRWTMVLSAADSGTPSSDQALTNFCRAYWYPLYAFTRRSGLASHDAADVTQSFFAYFLSSEALKKADRQRGKFRSFLLASLKNFLHNEWDKSKALKRGGAHQFLSIDELAAEQRYLAEPADGSSPEKFYDMQWSLALVTSVVDSLRADYTRRGKAALFEALEPYLVGEIPDGVLPALAAKFGFNLNTLKSRLRRLRRDEFGERLREHVRQTLDRPSEADVREELRHLFAAYAA